MKTYAIAFSGAMICFLLGTYPLCASPIEDLLPQAPSEAKPAPKVIPGTEAQKNKYAKYEDIAYSDNLWDEKYALSLSEKACTDKVLFTKQETGFFEGIECGDFCYLDLKLANGKNFSIMAGFGDDEKYAGFKGKKVSVTYVIERSYFPEPIFGCHVVPFLKSVQQIKE